MNTKPLLNISLAPGDLHLWITSLKHSINQIEELKRVLSKEELLRSQKFKVKKVQEEFIVGRGILKKILGRYLNRSANEIELDYEAMGKPKLTENLQNICPEIAFNLSHSHGFALYGITSNAYLGVDIEHRDRELNFEELAHRFLSPTEALEIKNAQELDKKKCFYTIWTKKEALLKALGVGLHSPLNQFTVSGKLKEESVFLPFNSKPMKWFVLSFDYDVNFSISIATNQKPQSIFFWNFEEL